MMTKRADFRFSKFCQITSENSSQNSQFKFEKILSLVMLILDNFLNKNISFSGLEKKAKVSKQEKY